MAFQTFDIPISKAMIPVLNCHLGPKAWLGSPASQVQDEVLGTRSVVGAECSVDVRKCWKKDGKKNRKNSSIRWFIRIIVFSSCVAISEVISCFQTNPMAKGFPAKHTLEMEPDNPGMELCRCKVRSMRFPLAVAVTMDSPSISTRIEIALILITSL